MTDPISLRSDARRSSLDEPALDPPRDPAAGAKTPAKPALDPPRDPAAGAKTPAKPPPAQPAPSPLDVDWDDAGSWGGMSRRAGASAAGAEPTTTLSPSARAWQSEAAAARTRAIDKPLEDDVVGNALVGVVFSAGGAGVVQAGMTTASPFSVKAAFGCEPVVIRRALGRDVVFGAAWSVGKSAVASAVTQAPLAVLAAEGPVTPGDAVLGTPASKAPAAPNDTSKAAAPPGDGAGRSSPRGASEEAPEPTRSDAPAYHPTPLLVRG